MDVRTKHEQVELVEFRQRIMGSQRSIVREVVADTSRDTTEHTTRSDLSSAQQQRNWSLARHFPFHRTSIPQGSNMETKQEGKRVQFLALYDVSAFLLNQIYSV